MCISWISLCRRIVSAIAMFAVATGMILRVSPVVLAQVSSASQVLPSAARSLRLEVSNSDSLPFRSPLLYDSGGNCYGGVCFNPIAAADLNGDGKLDLVVANGGTDNMGVLLGRGDGTFQTVVTYNVGPTPTSVAVGDLNNDGIPDLVFGFWGGGVAVMLGNGDGSFRQPVTYQSGGVQVNDVAIADVNGDRKPDVLVANWGSGTAVLLGNGDGTLQAPVLYPSGGWSLVVADLNGDGDPDLVLGGFIDNSVGVLLGNGDGTFRSGNTYPSGGSSAMSVAAADVNGDGKPDLVVTNCASISCPNEDGTVAVLLGNGDGTFHRAMRYDSGGGFANGVAVGDVDGDGKLDLVVANTFSNTVGVLSGRGDGTFRRVVTLDAGYIFPVSVLIADVNGDGKPDLLVFDGDYYSDGYSSKVAVLLGKTATSATLSSSLNPSIYGQKIVFTATVTTTSPVPATGTVAFTGTNNHGTFTIGTATVNSSGVATLARSNLNADPYPLTAVYKGDSNNLGSTSSVLNQTVLQTTSAATITSSQNPSAQGQPVTFTAKVTSPTVKPTGPVTFNAGTTVLGTVQLSGGSASYTTTSMPAGSTVITVTFDGDSNIMGSSATVTQVVQP